MEKTFDEIMSSKQPSDEEITNAEYGVIDRAEWFTEEIIPELELQCQISGSCNGYVRGQVSEGMFNRFLRNEIARGRDIKFKERPMDQTGSKIDNRIWCGPRIINGKLYEGRDVAFQDQQSLKNNIKFKNGKWYLKFAVNSSDKHESTASNGVMIDTSLTEFGSFDASVTSLWSPTRDWNLFAFILNSDLKKTSNKKQIPIDCIDEYINSGQIIIYDPINKTVEPPATTSFDEILDRIFLNPSIPPRKTKNGCSKFDFYKWFNKRTKKRQ